MRWMLAGLLAVLVLPTHPAHAACISTKCQDAEAIQRARTMIQDTCGCTRSGQTHGTYKKCVKSSLRLANLTALIPQKQCRKLIKKCENQSICGKPNAAVCCVLGKKNNVKASIVGSPGKCKGSACGALLGFYSKFDACAGDGTCAGPTTTTTTTSSSTTTTARPTTTTTESTTTTTESTTTTTESTTTTTPTSTTTTTT